MRLVGVGWRCALLGQCRHTLVHSPISAHDSHSALSSAQSSAEPTLLLASSSGSSQHVAAWPIMNDWPLNCGECGVL